MTAVLRKKKETFSQRFNIKKLDFIGSEFQLKYTKNGRYQTKLGGCLSLSLATLVTLALVATVKKFFEISSPEVSVSTKYLKEIPKFDLFKEEIFFHLSFFNEHITMVRPKTADLYKQFITVKSFLKRSELNWDTGNIEASYPQQFDYVNCRHVRNKQVLESLRWHENSLNMVDNFGLCPELENKTDQYFVQSKLQDPPFYSLVLYIYPCSLKNSKNCADLNDFKNAQVPFTLTKKGFDAANYSNPVSIINEFDEFVDIDHKFSKTLYYKVSKTEIWDDTWDFFDARLRDSFSAIEFKKSDFRSRNQTQTFCDPDVLDKPQQIECEPLLTIVIEGAGNQVIIRRTYPKFFMSLGEVGGTAEILTIIFVFIYAKYNWYFLFRHVQEGVFEKTDKEELEAALFATNHVQKVKNKQQKIQFEKNNNKRKRRSVKTRYSSSRRSKGRAESLFESVPQKTKQLENTKTVKSKGMTQNKRNMNKQKEKKKEKKKTAENIKIDALLSQSIEESKNGITFIKSLNELRILSKIIFKPRHQKLLPVVLLNMINQENDLREGAMKSSKKAIAYGILKSQEKMSLEQAFDRLNSSCHEGATELERTVDEFIFNNLPSNFKRRAKKSKIDAVEWPRCHTEVEHDMLAEDSERKGLKGMVKATKTSLFLDLEEEKEEELDINSGFLERSKVRQKSHRLLKDSPTRSQESKFPNHKISKRKRGSHHPFLTPRAVDRRTRKKDFGKRMRSRSTHLQLDVSPESKVHRHSAFQSGEQL